MIRSLNPLPALNRMAWRAIARVAVALRAPIIQRAQRRPYCHIVGEDGSLYMSRWWLFNPYAAREGEPDTRPRLWRLLPSVRVHHIHQPDQDRHLHDHPWNARTIVLKGWYIEQREDSASLHIRVEGDTARLLYGQYHRIVGLSDGGAITLFVTWRQRGDWGFLVDGKKVPWRLYLGNRQAYQRADGSTYSAGGEQA